MSSTIGSNPSDDFLSTIGQDLINLAREWVDVQKRGLNTEAEGLMRDAYGALALQLGVRANEFQEGNRPAADLAGVLIELRSEFVGVIETIKR